MYFTLTLIKLWHWTWMRIYYNDVIVNNDEWQWHCFEVQLFIFYSYSAKY